MLDKIHNNGSDAIDQSQNLEKIKNLGVSNPFAYDDTNFFIDESHISNEALKKYQRELDVQTFGEILKNTSQKEADELVLKQAFDGLLSIDDDNFLSELLNSKEFLNDLISED